MVRLQLLGGCSVRAEDRAIVGEAGQARRIALLVLLALARTGSLTREKLIGFLWPDTSTDQARHLLSESLYQLRRALGYRVVLTEGELVRLNGDGLSCDAVEFEAAIERGELESAISGYGGPFLDGFYVKDAPEFARWVEIERGRLVDAYAMALERLARAADAAGDHVEASRWWKRLIAHDPYVTRYVVGLMEALASAGDPANALLLAEEHARLLRNDLGVAPPDELTTCATHIREDLVGTTVAGAAIDEPCPIPTQPETPTRLDTPPRSTPGEGVSAGSRRSIRPWVLAVTGLAAAASVFLLAVHTPAASIAELREAKANARVAILPFTYRGNDDLRYLGESMSQLLSTTLEGFEDLHTVAPRVDQVAAANGGSTTELASVLGVAKRLGAKRILTGDVVEVDGRVRIDARLYDLTMGGTEPRAAEVVGRVGEFHELTDGLTRQLLIMLVGPIREVHLVAARTTDSVNALKAYLEGVAHRRAGRFTEAFDAFRRAVEIDSTFALAWHGMGVSAAWENMPEWDPGMDATIKAVRFSGTLPHRTQLVLRAHSAIMHGDGPEAERLARAVLNEHPGDVQAWFIIAWVGCLNPFYGRPVSEVREATERAYQYDPYDPDHQSGAAWFASRDGDWARLDSLWGDGLRTRAIRAFGSRDSAAQRRVMAEASTADADVLSRISGWMAMTVRDLPAATQFAHLAAVRFTDPEPRALAYVQWAQFEWALGRWRRAKAALDEVARDRPAWATLYRALWSSADFAPVSRAELERTRAAILAWDPTDTRPSVTHTGARAHDILSRQLRLYALGRIGLRLGTLDEVLEIARQLEAMDGPSAALTFGMDRAQSLRAHVAFLRGAYGDALAALEAQPRRIRIQWLYSNTFFYPCPEDRFLHAEALRRLERFDEALRWYATIQDITPYDAHFLAMSYLRRGEIYQHLGDDERAAQHFLEFIRLWENCDGELQPMVDRAQRAMGHPGVATRPDHTR